MNENGSKKGVLPVEWIMTDHKRKPHKNIEGNATKSRGRKPIRSPQATLVPNFLAMNFLEIWYHTILSCLGTMPCMVCVCLDWWRLPNHVMSLGNCPVDGMYITESIHNHIILSCRWFDVTLGDASHRHDAWRQSTNLISELASLPHPNAEGERCNAMAVLKTLNWFNAGN